MRLVEPPGWIRAMASSMARRLTGFCSGMMTWAISSNTTRLKRSLGRRFWTTLMQACLASSKGRPVMEPDRLSTMVKAALGRQSRVSVQNTDTVLPFCIHGYISCL
jgi:hypothetical protein